jgi:hypothetical protein
LLDRVHRTDCGTSFRDDMGDHAITGSAWPPYEIQAPIAPDARDIEFGMQLIGQGAAWIDNIDSKQIHVPLDRFDDRVHVPDYHGSIVVSQRLGERVLHVARLFEAYAFGAHSFGHLGEIRVLEIRAKGDIPRCLPLHVYEVERLIIENPRVAPVPPIPAALAAPG